MPQQHLRVDALGRETQFNVVHQSAPRHVWREFEGMLYEYALGFTRFFSIGGWKGSTEGVYVYRVASLSASQRLVLIEFLLDKTSMKDLYVVHPDGLAYGYCYEAGVLTQSNAPQHGVFEGITGERLGDAKQTERLTEFNRYGDQYAAGRLQGASHNGYPDPVLPPSIRPTSDMDFDAYQLICPLADFTVRWSMYSANSKEKVRNWLSRSGYSIHEVRVILDFMDAFDRAQE